MKCEPYWPTEVHEPKQYGEVVVDPISVSTLNKYNITIFNVSMVSYSQCLDSHVYVNDLDYIKQK